MNYRKIEVTEIDILWQLQLSYKKEIGEDEPTIKNRSSLEDAIRSGIIDFYGAWDKTKLVGCCSITTCFSTFNYEVSGIFEDFYIVPELRHKGIARDLVRYAYNNSGVKTLTVGCADCDIEMYKALGFKVNLGNLLAFE